MSAVRSVARVSVTALVAGVLLWVAFLVANGTLRAVARPAAKPSPRNALYVQGQKTFRYDTFGDESFWGGALQLHKAIEGKKLGGVGSGVSPKTALSVGLKVDAAKIPGSVATAIKAGKVDLNSPKTTLALLKLNAVVGVKGIFDKNGSLKSMGLSCAVCHSTVDDSFAPGIGRRLDGWPNRDLNVGAIISLAPDKKPLTDLLKVDEATLGKVLASWGPGKFDAEVFLDGKAFRPDGKTAATLIPRPSASPASTCTRTRAGARCPTGTRSSRTSRCTASVTSTTPGSRTRSSSRSPHAPASPTCGTART